MATNFKIYPGNSTELIFYKVKIGASYLDENVNTFQIPAIEDVGGDPLAGTFPIDFVYQAGSRGEFRALIPASIPFVSGESYTILVTLQDGAGRDAYWELPVEAITRSGFDVA
jgi:hypothetical protein